MAQKQSALATLQGQVAAVGRSSEGNAAQIAALQEAMAGLQSQRLDLQRADLSGRLAVLQDIAAQAYLSGAAKARPLLSPDPLMANSLKLLGVALINSVRWNFPASVWRHRDQPMLTRV